jgi:hypothetical protein
MTVAAGTLALGRWPHSAAECHSLLVGTVTGSGGMPLVGARVTLVNEAGQLISERRVGPEGSFSLDVYESGNYRLGASLPGYGYREVPQPLSDCGGEIDAPELILTQDTHPGRWTRIGDTSPEYLGATNSGTLLPDGRILYCHDTDDPVIFDPVTGAKFIPRGSGTPQGCHATTVLLDGRVLYVGGQDGETPGTFRNGIPWVKAYDPASDSWERWPDLNEARWYPTVTRLPDGRLLVTGGGQPPDARRTDTAEILDPATQRAMPTGRMLNPAEFGPSVLLFDGRVLRSWWPPQVWHPSTGKWQAIGPFVQPDRGFPDHSPHSLVLLADGRAAAVGMLGGGTDPSMLELFDPASDSWTRGPSPATLRARPEVVLLPDGRVLAAGGHKEILDQPGETNRWGYVALADLYDPVANRWRSVAPMPIAREYHALTILAPDGRVIVTAGTGEPGAGGEGTDNRVDAYEPPYLFRGPRPVIERLDTTDLHHGQSFTLSLSGTLMPTAVALIGLNAVTHYVDGGAGRLVRLPFTQTGGTLSVQVPDDSLRLPAAHYLLFVLVDDIPSAGRVVRVTPAPDLATATPPPPTRWPVFLPWASR